jgi:hypothetical protein
MRPIIVKKQVDDDECGVCLSFSIYCLVHGFDYHAIPTDKFNNHSRLLMFYTVMSSNLTKMIATSLCLMKI